MKSLGASLHLGAAVRDDGVVFRAWAPRCRTLDVVIEGRRPLAMSRQDDGLFEAVVAGLRPGTRYQYRLDGARYRPDPASRFQPEGVHGPSMAVNPGSFPWTDQVFTGHALADLVIYELHVGTFTRVGTFEAIVPHLPHLVDLGVTAVELMPVAEFPGSRNWGYDGVHLFAAQSTYGGPRGLRRLVGACHAHGLSVILDVVYNHLGPEGNYLRECHVDGLRLDAIYAIFDASPVHILSEIATAAREEAGALGRPVHVMAESHDNDRRIVLPAAEGGLGLDAVWSDDFHHALHARLTGERGGYYADFTEPRRLPTALAEGFAFQGEYSEYFGRDRGTPSADLPGERFVICVQNHDQVGNRAQGDRLSTIAPFEAVKLAAALLLVAPAVPLLFMGEEYGETSPFQFFTSFLDRDLAEAVKKGRTEEFSRFAWQGAVPDPGEPATFVRSRLNHPLAGAPRHRELYQYYRRWLALRRTHPALGARGKERAQAEIDAKGAMLTLSRDAESGPGLRLIANLTNEARPAPTVPADWRLLLNSDDPRFAGQARPPLAPFHVLLRRTWKGAS